MAFNTTVSPEQKILFPPETVVNGALGSGFVVMFIGADSLPVQPLAVQVAVMVIGWFTAKEIGFPWSPLLQLTVPLHSAALTLTVAPIQTLVEGIFIESSGFDGIGFTVNLLLEMGLVT